MKKKRLVIFDLDGVIVDSKKNMNIAWNDTSKKFQLNISFQKYFKFLGKSFYEILKSLGIKKNFENIANHYSKISLKNFNKIKLYKGVKNTLNFIKKENYICIVTSKDKFRTKKLVKYFELKFDYLGCPKKKLRPKPWPDQILKCINKFDIKKKDIFYIGDTYLNFLSAKRAGISFIYAKYGYGSEKKSYKTEINSIKNLRKFFE